MLTRTKNALGGIFAPCLWAGLAALLAFTPVGAQDEITVDVSRCFAIESAEARRECFANQVDDVLEERAAGAAAQAPESPTAIADTPIDSGGIASTAPAPRTEPARSRRSGDESQGRETGNEQGEYLGTIVSLRERLPNAYEITLDTGQVWQQTQPEMYPLRPGLEVRIYPTSWGDSYRLVGRNVGRHIQVRRVQ